MGFYRTTFTVDERRLESYRSVYIAFGGVESCYYELAEEIIENLQSAPESFMELKGQL